MKNLFAVIIFIAVAMSVVNLISRKFRISERYDRAPRELSAWKSLDKGIDPTKGKKK
ncbi:unannotated protein [freshwater metagenome]|uniref:Unannotated protein n=1 Tax=freshwater metagenome TaxID=449393 RepID=A0A6J7D654_9ZZZZ